jgi:hypothetical protein
VAELAAGRVGAGQVEDIGSDLGSDPAADIGVAAGPMAAGGRQGPGRKLLWQELQLQWCKVLWLTWSFPFLGRDSTYDCLDASLVGKLCWIRVVRAAVKLNSDRDRGPEWSSEGGCG